jgi:aryl-alcohol dehydrogenase-like predicted oxidoreductase
MKLVLGTVQMGLDYGVNNKTGKINTSESIRILEFAYEHGIRVLDTAEAYGSAHQVIGEYHKLHPSYQFNIITKVPKQLDKDLVLTKVEQYLNDLNVSKIHLLMCHDFATYRQNNYLADCLLELRTSEIVDQVGVSVYTNAQVMNLLSDINKVDVIQLPYNLLDNMYQRGMVLECMKLQGVSAHTRSPFLQGMFFLDENSGNKTYQFLENHIKELKIIANSAGVSMYELALQYSFINSLSDAIIIGVDSLDQLKLNFQALSDKVLSRDIIDRIDKIEVINPDLLNPSLWN